MTRPSFHERVWDLQQRKAGAERLKNHLDFERIVAKMQLNSIYGKTFVRPIDTQFDWLDASQKIFYRLRAKRFEIEKLAREFRPF